MSRSTHSPLRSALLAILVLAPVHAATAQPAADPLAEPATPAAGTPAGTPAAEPPAESIDDIPDDVPDDPTYGEDEPEVAPQVTKAAYPRQELDRPLNLLGGMAEFALDAKAVLAPEVGTTFSLRYGIVSRVQFGVTYGGASGYDKPTASGSSFSWETGKSISADLQVGIVDGVALRASLPMYLDPFAMGLVLSTPLRIKVASKVAIVGFDDVLSLRLKRFMPVLGSEGANLGLVARDAQNSVMPRGDLRLVPGVLYQYSDRLSLTGTFGLLFADFEGQDVGVHLKGRALYSLRKQVDLWGTVGWDNLDAAADSLGIQVGIAARL